MTNYRPVSPQEKAQIISAFKSGKSLEKIKTDYNRASQTIKSVLAEHGLKPAKPNYDGLYSTSRGGQQLGISPNTFIRLVKALEIQPAAKTNMGGWYYTAEHLSRIRASEEYKAVLNTRNHRKNAVNSKTRFKIPYNPDDLARCALCANLGPNRQCTERKVTLSSLSLRCAYIDCHYYRRKETAPMK